MHGGASTGVRCITAEIAGVVLGWKLRALRARWQFSRWSKIAGSLRFAIRNSHMIHILLAGLWGYLLGAIHDMNTDHVSQTSDDNYYHDFTIEYDASFLSQLNSLGLVENVGGGGETTTNTDIIEVEDPDIGIDAQRRGVVY